MALYVFDTTVKQVFELISKTQEVDNFGFDCVIHNGTYGYCSQHSSNLQVVNQKKIRPIAPTKKPKNTYTDSSNNVWRIEKETLTRLVGRGGDYTYYVAETLDGKYTLRDKLRKELIANIELKFGNHETINTTTK